MVLLRGRIIQIRSCAGRQATIEGRIAENLRYGALYLSNATRQTVSN